MCPGVWPNHPILPHEHADETGHKQTPPASLRAFVQIERLDERRQIVAVVVHVVAVPGLARTAMAAAVMGDGAIAMGGHEERLYLLYRTTRWLNGQGLLLFLCSSPRFSSRSPTMLRAFYSTL